MTFPLFTDTVTLYGKRGAEYVRTVLAGVQWRQKAERLNDDGKLTFKAATVVTVPAAVGADVLPGDVLVYGTAPELTEEYTIAHLRADYPTYCTVQTVADHRNRPRLKHRKVTAV